MFFALAQILASCIRCPSHFKKSVHAEPMLDAGGVEQLGEMQEIR